MSASRSRQFVTFLLVIGAVFFGMVLAGGLEMTVPSIGAPQSGASPVTLSEASSVQGLPSFADLAEAVEPAVVSIAAATIQETSRRRTDPFEFFFGPRRGPGDPRDPRDPRDQPQQRRFRQDSGGSGFVISSDGLIITNNHVVDGADQLRVSLNGREYPAEVKGTDPATDLALIQVDAGENLAYLELGDSERLRVGDWVMAIGSPLSLDHSVTIGVVSAKGRSIGISDVSFENFIQTDAAINFGNSGGPLVNTRGQVVGINTAINFGAENIGFAVPVNTLRQILPQLREKGRVSRGYLGIQITNLEFDEAQAFGLDEAGGALVQTVEEDSPAGKAGVEHGDIILKVDDIDVEETRDLINYVSQEPPGSTVMLQILRDGKRLDRKIELAERPGFGDTTPVEMEDVEGGIDWLGIQYQSLTPGLRDMHGIPEDAEGIWITNVEPDSPLYEENVRAGDLIVEINGEPVTGVEAFEQAVEGQQSGSFLRLYVRRFGQGGQQVSFFAFVRVP